jgi:F-type H+-transporting ATPase subunit a
MIAPLAAALLALATTQHQASPAPLHAEHGPVVEHAAPGGHAGGAEEETLGDAIMHHVSNGTVMEVPGICPLPGESGLSGWHWNCEIDLAEHFGWTFKVAGVQFDMTPTKHLVMMWLASLLLFLTFVITVRRRSAVPKGAYNFLEMLVVFVRDELAVKNIGERDAHRFVPYLCTAFFFILFCNLIGLIPYAATPTANLAVTAGLAGFTFLITQFASIKAMGLGGFLKHLTGGVAPWLWPIMVPVEILGLFTKPFALTIRLFANMTAGHVVILSLLGIIFALKTPFMAAVSVPFALFIFVLELFVAFVQAYIFTMLSALFIGMGVAHHGDDHDGAEHGAEHHQR